MNKLAFWCDFIAQSAIENIFVQSRACCFFVSHSTKKIQLFKCHTSCFILLSSPSQIKEYQSEKLKANGFRWRLSIDSENGRNHPQTRIMLAHLWIGILIDSEIVVINQNSQWASTSSNSLNLQIWNTILAVNWFILIQSIVNHIR